MLLHVASLTVPKEELYLPIGSGQNPKDATTSSRESWETKVLAAPSVGLTFLLSKKIDNTTRPLVRNRLTNIRWRLCPIRAMTQVRLPLQACLLLPEISNG